MKKARRYELKKGYFRAKEANDLWQKELEFILVCEEQRRVR